MDRELSYFHSFWQKQHMPLHFHHAETWYKKYADEVNFYLGDKRKLIDAGCGNGEMIKYLSDKADFIMGVDYSQSMIDSAKTNLKDIDQNKYSLNVGSVTDMKTFSKMKFDGLYGNTIIQYLNEPDFHKLLDSLKDILTDDATILFMNLPNKNFKLLYKNRVYHEQHLREYKNSDYLWFILKDFCSSLTRRMKSGLRKIIKGEGFLNLDAVGYWSTPKFFIETCSKYGYQVEILNSIYPPYGYRFHVLLKKINDQ